MLSKVLWFCAALALTGVAAISAQAQWYPPEQITANSIDEMSYPGGLAIDGNDLLHAVWLQYDSSTGDRRIMYMEGRHGAWGTPVEIPAPAPDCHHPDLAVHTNGAAHVVWMQGSGDLGEIYHATNASGQWVHEQITANSTSDLDPVVAVDGDNVPHVAWAGFDPATGEGKIFYASKSAGSWSISVLSGSTLGGFWTGADPRISVSQAGVVQIAYRGGDYGAYGVHHAAIVGGAWKYQVLPTPNVDDYTASVRTDPYNTCHLTISGNDGWGMPGHVYYCTSVDQGASWSSPELVSGSHSGVGAVLGVDWYGAAHAVWEETSGNFYTGKIFHSTNESGAWTSETIAAKDENMGPSIAIDGSGGVHVLYVNAFYSGGYVKEVYYLTNSRPLLTLSMTPRGSTVIPRGGSLALDIVAANQVSMPAPTVFYMTAVRAATGTEVMVPAPILSIPNPVQGIVNSVVSVTATLSIPPGAPLGLFTLAGTAVNTATGDPYDKAAVAIRIVP
jgi:hypothetical protein